MKRSIALLLFFALPVFAQHLPTGSYQANRERTYDLIHLAADLRVDWVKKDIVGNAELRFTPLVRLSAIVFDAYGFDVSAVVEVPSGKKLSFAAGDRSLSVELGRTVEGGDTVTVRISYRAHPTAGLYFVDPSVGTNNMRAIFTYGEGGIHANWLPLYNDVNDKFSSDMTVTLEKPYVAISNGRLLSTNENSDGTRTYRWSQTLPHSNYLIGLFVGDYVAVPLRPAFGTIPLSAWVHPGQEEVGALVFGRTPDMIEFFSNRFDYKYPWDKYDQISAYDYAIGAMENTGITGHNDRILRPANQHEEFNPDAERYTSNWTAESIISHELAHHWFGDLVTCRNLSSLWLNESFASYLMMLWDEHRLGEDALRAYTTVALTDYLRYVQTDHVIRPLEYRYFDTRGQIYNEQTTYQKGGVVLHMLRWVVGDDAFFKALGYYLKKHAFGNVESYDLKVAFEERVGVNLQWFFDDWVWGGGHPVFEVSSTYLKDRKTVELDIAQVQARVEGQDLFRLPVEIRVDAGGKTERHRVWVEHETDHFSIAVAGEPDLVSIDGRGFLVADIRYPKTLDALTRQIERDDLPGKIRALRAIVRDYPGDPKTLEVIRAVIRGTSHWFVKAEATLLLRGIQSIEAERLLLEQLRFAKYQVRKAAVIALGSRPTVGARTALRSFIDTAPVNDVAATAIVSLAKIDPNLSAEFFKRHLGASSWYNVKTIGALAAMGSIGKREFVPLITPYADMKYNYAIRTAALEAWAACAPDDAELREKALPRFARYDFLDVRVTAMNLLAKLKVKSALPVLKELAEKNGDGDIRAAAAEAIEKIERE